MRTAVCSLLLASLACRGDGDEGDTGGSTPDGVFVPDLFGVRRAWFAVGATGQAEGYTGLDGVAVPITVEVVLGTKDAAGLLTDETSCTVTLEHPGPLGPAPWSSAVPAWFTFEVPAGSTTESDCDRFTFPAAWGDVGSVVGGWPWGVGVAELDPAVATEVEASVTAEEWAELAPFVAGGGFRWGGPDLGAPWPENWVGRAATFAYEVDDALVQVSVGGYGVLLDAASIATVDGVVPALYDVQPTALLTPASLLP